MEICRNGGRVSKKPLSLPRRYTSRQAHQVSESSRSTASSCATCLADQEAAIARCVPSASGHELRLSGNDLGQRQLNSIHLFTDHPDGLVMARIRHRVDRFYRATDFVAAVPNKVGSRGSLHSVEVDSFRQFCSHPCEHYSEQHLDRKTIGCSIEISERKSIHGF